MISEEDQFFRSSEFSKLPYEMKTYLEPSIRAGFRAAREIQSMHDHPLYRIGEYIHNRTGLFPNLGEILYSLRAGGLKELFCEMREERNARRAENREV